MRSRLFAVHLFAAATLLYGQSSDISVANTAHYIGSNRWAWTVYLLADSDILSQIRCVEYRLHPTFPNPVRQICQKGSDDQPFAFSTEGWGEFLIPIKVMFAKGQTVELNYDLKLVETGCAKAFDEFALVEGQFHAIKGVSQPPVYVYAESINKLNHDLHFRLFRTNRPIPGTGPTNLMSQLRKVHTKHGATLDADIYIKFELSPARGRAEIVVPLSDKEVIGLAVSNPAAHEAIRVKICR